jgi:hypothetical protein
VFEGDRGGKGLKIELKTVDHERLSFVLPPIGKHTPCAGQISELRV